MMYNNSYLDEILPEVGGTPQQYLRAARHMGDSTDDLFVQRLAVLSTFSAEFLEPYLKVEAARRGVAAKISISPIGQVEVQLLNPDSELFSFDPTVIFVAARLEDMIPDLPLRLLEEDGSEACRLVESAVRQLADACVTALGRTTAQLFIFNFSDPIWPAAGFADQTTNISHGHAVEIANTILIDIASATSRMHMFDYRRWLNRVGTDRAYDSRKRLWAGLPYASGVLGSLAGEMARNMRAATTSPLKCLVLDLDNVLWGGIVGEDGIDGIQLGGGYPGNAFKEFQRTLKIFSRRGIILAISSKNNFDDAMDIFNNHEDCVLGLDDFAAVRICWDDKATSIRSIANELNIGLDSIAFFDDSAFERDWVRTELSEVHVIEVPNDPAQYEAILHDCEIFDQLGISFEDRARNDTYKANRRRQELKSEVGNEQDFLRTLSLQACVDEITEETMGRVCQLIVKTNQFNLTLRRHSVGDLEKILSGGGIGLWMRLRDRFGDYGLIGVAVANPGQGGVWNIDTFLMSCRALGRRAEYVLLNRILNKCLTSGADAVYGQFVEGRRNGQVASFYQDAGFASIGNSWIWRRGMPEVRIPEFIEVREAHESNIATG